MILELKHNFVPPRVTWTNLSCSWSDPSAIECRHKWRNRFALCSYTSQSPCHLDDGPTHWQSTWYPGNRWLKTNNGANRIYIIYMPEPNIYRCNERHTEFGQTTPTDWWTGHQAPVIIILFIGSYNNNQSVGVVFPNSVCLSVSWVWR